MKTRLDIQTPADQHSALKHKRRQRLAMLATYHTDPDTERGVHQTLDAQDEAERILRGVLGRGQ